MELGPGQIVSGRFELLRRVGAGAFGTVYEAIDHDRSERLALKVLQRLDPEALFRFKEEFRLAQGLQHPNLVRFMELFEVRGTWFLTMEFVTGVDFLEHVRPRLDPACWHTIEGAERLRRATLQLIDALSALHDAGLVHRDVKPSNVRVERGGRLVLLDFGLIGRPGNTSFVGGTPAYMPPETLAGEPATGASDYYALGVMLYEALAGSLPQWVLEGTQRVRAPSELHGHVPPDLEQVCLGLLADCAKDRPIPSSMRATLGASRAAEEVTQEPVALPFVGRSAQLLQLKQMAQLVGDGRPVLVCVEGESGVGKTSLVRAYLQQLQQGQADTLVLEGRCFEREDVAHKAFDGVVDALARFLRKLPPEVCRGYLPRRAGLCSVLFPVLGRVPGIANAPAYPSPLDPRALRDMAMSAFLELLGRVAESKNLVLWVDDFQWTDIDSVELLRQLLRPGDAPSCLVVLSTRSTDSMPVATRRLLVPLLSAQADLRLTLAGLTEAEARTLAIELALDDPDGALTQNLLRETAGHPLFLIELIRHVQESKGEAIGSVRLDEAIGGRLQALSPALRPIMETLAIAGKPQRPRTLASLLGAPEGEVRRDLMQLVARRLVRWTPSGGLVECYHDRIREAAFVRVPQSRLLETRQALARTLTSEGSEPEQVAELWMQCGELARARGYWLQAAKRATANLAFERAVELYERARECGADPDANNTFEIDLARAEALSGAGRLEDASVLFLRLADLAPPTDRKRLRARALQHMLQGGKYYEGLALASEVFRAEGLTLRLRHAIPFMLWHRAMLSLRGLDFEVRDQASLKPDQAAQLDALWSVAPWLVYMSMWLGATLQAEHLRLALKTGHLEHIARGLVHEAILLSASEVSPKKVPVLLARAEAIAELRDDDYLRASCAMGQAHAQFGALHFSAAAAQFDRSARMFEERCTHVLWEKTMARGGALVARLLRGSFREHAALAEKWSKEARERGDRYAVGTLCCFGMAWNRHLVRGDAQAAREELETALPDGNSGIAQALQLSGLYLIRLFQRDRSAGEELERTWEALLRAQLLRAPLVGATTRWLRGQSLLAHAGSLRGVERTRRLAFIRREASVSTRRWPACERPLAEMIWAQLAVLEGRPDQAILYLRNALQEMSSIDWHYVYGARLLLGRLLGGDEGDQLVRSALAWEREQGFEPFAFLLCHAPVLWED